MSITDQFTHTLGDGIEQYAFPSQLTPKQKHFVDRYDDGPWEVSIANFPESLSVEDTQTLVAEIAALAAFAEQLNQSQLCRHTEPGQPRAEDLQGVGL